ncbi:phosphate acetyltransferase [Arcanobacterium haemolyticum]|uniref:Phosphate acetyltransferase n=1 Tax=Arcanobacterium haemolyticum (strain ATCC 9345 / DSM 20595 / CCM 5947 / CCUG 17215 / LMG 16163 / NBRC 15585 / NCTC 8452 / 11018) TaxID=644284 RepID=D7BK38_ARCHD|nr:phosphate acetyltransferase [Arcanobacterium haemolyticum]ADH93018.1 phosphate acetyltransferase [Arcanobacterium haemolyticum DSM 20595]SQH28225.1 Phosphate acetyltransferase [Arcanobacterium haemolyticum]
MTHSLYFTAAEGNVGTQALVRTFVTSLKERYTSVGVFRAFTNGPVDQDLPFKEALELVGRSEDLDLAWGATRQAYVANEEAAMADMVKRYTDYAEEFDAVLILGLLDGDPLNPGALSRTGRAAANLSTTVLFAVSGSLRTPAQLDTVISLSANEFTGQHAPISGVVVTNADMGTVTETQIGDAIVFGDGRAVELDEAGKERLVAAMEKGSDVVTPLSFQSWLISRARSDRKRIVLPEATDPRILRAAAELLAREVADIILIGDAEEIHAHATELGVDVSKARIVSVDDPELNEKYAIEFARLREKKGVTVDMAREKVKDLSYFGTMMVHMDDADGMVSGAIHTTAHTIVPSFQIIKTKPGAALVSSCFLMLMEDRVYVYGDCAVNTNPTPQELAGIAVSSAETARAFGVEPRVAMLSYSTGTSGKGPDVDAVVEATQIAREMAPELALEGPIQYDAAVDSYVAKTKLPDSPVAGKANVFVFPSLNAGNIGYKAVQRSAGAVAVGPVLQGLNKPVNDLSRGALVEDIVNTVAITAIQAQN